MLYAYASDRGIDQSVPTRSHISALYAVSCLDDVIFLVFILDISRLWLAHVPEQTVFCLSRLKSPKTGFFSQQDEKHVLVGDKLSLVMGKLAFCMCKNKDADQQRSNCATGQRLCFRYMESTIPLLSKSEISSV